MAKLSEQQRRFVEEYMGDSAGNATEAARCAGYASPRQAGSRLLTYDYIQEAVAKRVEADPAIATREDRQRFWTEVMGEKDEAMRDRLKASELMGKSQLDFVIQVQGEGGGPITMRTEVVLVKAKGKDDG